MALTDSEKTGLLFKKVFAGKSSTDDARAFFEEPKDGKSFVNIENVLPNSSLEDIHIYEFDTFITFFFNNCKSLLFVYTINCISLNCKKFSRCLFPIEP